MKQHLKGPNMVELPPCKECITLAICHNQKVTNLMNKCYPVFKYVIDYIRDPSMPNDPCQMDMVINQDKVNILQQYIKDLVKQ